MTKCKHTKAEIASTVGIIVGILTIIGILFGVARFIYNNNNQIKQAIVLEVKDMFHQSESRMRKERELERNALMQNHKDAFLKLEQGQTSLNEGQKKLVHRSEVTEGAVKDLIKKVEPIERLEEYYEDLEYKGLSYIFSHEHKND